MKHRILTVKLIKPISYGLSFNTVYHKFLFKVGLKGVSMSTFEKIGCGSWRKLKESTMPLDLNIDDFASAFSHLNIIQDEYF